MSNNLVTSVIRTYTPIAVGALASYALVTFGLDIDAEAQNGLVLFLTAILQGAYYLVARLLERKFPELGFLLGRAAVPKYVAPTK